jgi:ribosome-associated translation inhibitor RaiA
VLPAPGEQLGRAELSRRAETEKLQGGAQVFLVADGIQRRGVVLFAQFPAGRVCDDRMVEIGRLGQAERALQQNLAGGRVQQIRAADDVGDSLRGIVDDNGPKGGIDQRCEVGVELNDGRRLRARARAGLIPDAIDRALRRIAVALSREQARRIAERRRVPWLRRGGRSRPPEPAPG